MSISIRLGDSLSIHDKVKLTKIGQAAIFCSATDKLFNTKFTGVKAQMIKNSGLEGAVSQSGFVTAINRNGGSHWLLAILNGNSEVAAICPIDKGTGCYGHPAIQFFREKALEICAWVNSEKEARSEKMKAKKERIMPTEVSEIQTAKVDHAAISAEAVKGERTRREQLAPVVRVSEDLNKCSYQEKNELLAELLPANETDQVMLILSMLKGMSATNQDWVASELAAMRVQATTPDVAVAI